MGLDVKVTNMGEVSSESRAAEFLKERIRETIPSEANGEIQIIAGVNIPFGKVSDIDILLVVNVENCCIQIDNQDVDVKSFCTTIELKEQTVDDVYATTTDVFVNYPSTNIRKNATEQNRNQKYTLLKYCQKSKHENLFISNFLWLRSVSADEWNNKGWNVDAPVLLSYFDFCDIVKQIVKSGHRIFNGAIAVRNNDTDSLNRLIKELTVTRPIPPQQLRKKVEHLVAATLMENVDGIMKSEDLCCVDGKAGTGKTFLLLNAALKRAEDGYACALLTYNKALTLDLQRLVYFVKTSSDARSNLEISTLFSYMQSMAVKLGWGRTYTPDGFLEFVRNLSESHNCIPLYDTNMYELDDYVFIDEAQDCTPTEKDILEIVFGKRRIVVAKSALQKIRRLYAAKWGNPTIKLSTGLRQKSNIVEFLKSLANEMGIADTCAGQTSIIAGGKVMILPEYTTDVHTELENICSAAGCSNYDILVLMPPTMVKNQQFINAHIWKTVGRIKLIDGTNTSALEACTHEELIDNCRIYQYESCRGLEGWATVCYNLDDIVEFKQREASAVNVIGDVREQEVYQWIMMPLTRAIDTLVITIKDIHSPLAGLLRTVAGKHQDFVVCKI